MLKAIVSYSKKIPVPGAEFSSQGYSLSLETEVAETEPAAIQARLHGVYDLVRSTVDRELATGCAAGPAPEPARKPPAAKASNKQIKFLTDLATRQGVSLSELNASVRERFGVEGLYDLDRKQASALLDELHGPRKAA